MGRPLVDDLLRRALGTPTDEPDWSAAVARLDRHGLIPLAHTRVEELGMVLPALARRELALLRRARGRRQRRALGELLSACARAGVSPIVLKGAALAELVYDQPHLRPMDDLDLLVSPGERQAAVAALGAAGFEVRAGAGQASKHTTFVGDEPGGHVVVELHDNLFAPGHRLAGRLDELVAEPAALSIEGAAARALRPEAMLVHLCAHLVGHADVFTPLRLIWAADVLLCAERYAAEVDWRWVGRVAPFAPEVMALLREAARLDGPLDFEGWPRRPLGAQRRGGTSLRRIASDTLAPPAWWLRLRHGLGPERSLVWERWVRHPLEIGGLVVRNLGERLRLEAAV